MERKEKNIVQIGNVYPRATRDNPQRGRLYSVKGLSPSVQTYQGGGTTTNDYRNMERVKRKVLAYSRDHKGKIVNYHTKDISNTVHTLTCGGGNTATWVIEYYRKR